MWLRSVLGLIPRLRTISALPALVESTRGTSSSRPVRRGQHLAGAGGLQPRYQAVGDGHQIPLPLGERARRLAEIGRRRVFGEIAAGANVHRRLDVLMRLEHAEHADGDLSIASANLLDSLDATHARHLQVHQDQVGVKAGRHPFAAYFADCPAYEPELCIPCNLRGAPLTPIWSCSYLTVGEDAEQRGHMCVRCRIGDRV